MFLSIVTRTHNRPELLTRNMASVAAQTEQDLEHIILHDPVGRGIEWANAQYGRYGWALSGEYVLMLDDDNVLSEVDAVAALKATASISNADVIQFMADVGPNGVLPHDLSWQNPPQQYHVDGHTIAVRRDVWLEHIGAFDGPRCADYRFLRALWDANVSVAHVDRILVEALAVGGLGWRKS